MVQCKMKWNGRGLCRFQKFATQRYNAPNRTKIQHLVRKLLIFALRMAVSCQCYLLCSFVSHVFASSPLLPCTLCTLLTTLSRGFTLLCSPYAAYSLIKDFSAKCTFSAPSCLVHRWGTFSYTCANDYSGNPQAAYSSNQGSQLSSRLLLQARPWVKG